MVEAIAGVRSALGDAVPFRSAGALEIAEVTGRDLVQFAGWPGRFEQALDIVAELVGCPAPADTRAAASRGEVTLFRVGPERLWIAAPLAHDTAARLRRAFAADAGVVTELGHSRTVLRLAGPAAATLLARCVAVDLDPAAFPAGAFAQTPLHQVGVLLHRTGEQGFDLYVPRSYALSVMQWLRDIAPFACGG